MHGQHHTARQEHESVQHPHSSSGPQPPQDAFHAGAAGFFSLDILLAAPAAAAATAVWVAVEPTSFVPA